MVLFKKNVFEKRQFDLKLLLHFKHTSNCYTVTGCRAVAILLTQTMYAFVLGKLASELLQFDKNWLASLHLGHTEVFEATSD